jgi:hypothetical protein
VENRPHAHVVTPQGVSTLKKLLGKYEGTLATCRVRESAELRKSKVTGVDGHDIEKASLRLGVTEFFDSLDLLIRHFHGDKVSAVISSSILLGWCQDTRGALAPCSGFYLRVRRAIPRPSATPSGSPQVIRGHQTGEGKVGENPLTYREALRKEKVRKNLWQDVGYLWRSIDTENSRMAGFYIPFPLLGHITRKQWRNLTRTANGYSRKFS